MIDLANTLKDSLSKKAIPVSVDFLENEIDTLISNNTFRNVPVLNAIGSLIEIGKDLHERNLLKQTSIFLSEFNSGLVSEEKLNKYKAKLENDKKKISELDRVLLILNSNIDAEKSKILARLFAAYIDEMISWSDFCEYSDATNRLFIEDLRILRALHENSDATPRIGDNYRTERLYAIGLVGINYISFGNKTDLQGWEGWSLNRLGKTYCDIIFDKEDS